MSDSLTFMPRTIEAANLPPDARARVAAIFSELESTFLLCAAHEKYSLEELAISTFKVEQFEQTIALIRSRFESESEWAWDALHQRNCHHDFRQFAQNRSQTRSATVKTAELAEEIASAWEQFATFIENNQKHLVSLDELWLLLKYEGQPTHLQQLNKPAQWLALHFLAHNQRQEHFIRTWIKLDRIRDASTFVERMLTLINAMPDQAIVHEALLSHAKARAAYWQNRSEALKEQAAQEKSSFKSSFQGTRETRDQLRFQLTCRRFELAHGTRLKKEVQRFVIAREKASQPRLPRQKTEPSATNPPHQPIQPAEQKAEDIEKLQDEITDVQPDDQLNGWDYSEDESQNKEHAHQILSDVSGEEIIPELDDSNSNIIQDVSFVTEIEKSTPDTSPESFDFIDVNGKLYTKEDLDKVDDILQIIIGEYLAMLPPEVKHSTDFIDGMSDPERYSDFLMKAITAVTDSKLERLYHLQCKINRHKSHILSITGPSSPHGTRLFDDLRMDITEEMLKPHLKKIRREAAAEKKGGIKPPKRLFKNDPRRTKPPD